MKKQKMEGLNMTKTAKEMKETALQIVANGVRNREQFNEAVPQLVSLTERIAKIASSLNEMKKLQTALNNIVSDYADNNPKAFDSIREVKDEADVSIVVIDGVEYAYKRGWDGVKRISGDNKTAAFLEALPKQWVKTKLEIAVSELNRLDVSESELKKHDLEWCAKRTWERVE